MQYTCRTKTLQALAKAMQKNTLLLTHKLQRREGQWSTKMKSELIDSLLRNYPINPTYCVKDGEILYTIDGVQRLSCIRDFINNKFMLSRTLEPIKVNGVVKEIAGKKFKNLDEDTQDALLNCELQVYELVDYTDKEVRQMFSRQNSGKRLNNRQLRSSIETDTFREVISSLTSHPFFEKCCTKAQLKSDVDKDIVLQVLILTEKTDHISFRSKDINNFILEYQDHIDHNKVSTIKEALNKLNNEFDELKIKQLSLPMIVFGCYSTIVEKKSVPKYMTWLKKFIKAYDSNNDYLKYCVSGTSSEEMVMGRLNYFKKAIKTL